MNKINVTLDPAKPQQMLHACPAYRPSPLALHEVAGQQVWIKDETNRMGLGAFKAMGGIPIDRKAAKDVVGQMSDWFASQDKAWIGITPEGTRGKVTKYKKGYLRIAYATGVPVFIVGVNSETRELVFDRFHDLTGDIDVDNAAIRTFVRNGYTGLKPINS